MGILNIASKAVGAVADMVFGGDAGEALEIGARELFDISDSFDFADVGGAVGGVLKPLIGAAKATINQPYGAGGSTSSRGMGIQQLSGNMMPINGNGPGRSGNTGQVKTNSYEEWKNSWDRRMVALLQANNDAGLSSTVSRNRIYGRKRR